MPVNGLTLFAPDQLAAIVEKTLPHETSAGGGVLVAAVDTDGAKIVAQFEKGEHWTFQGAVKYDWSGETTVGAKVLVRW